MDAEDTGAGVDPRIHRSPDDTDVNLTEATLALHDWEEEEERRRDEAIANRKSFEGLQIDPDIDFYPEVADREPGDRNIVRAGFDIHPQVTFWASGFLVVFIRPVDIRRRHPGLLRPYSRLHQRVARLVLHP